MNIRLLYTFLLLLFCSGSAWAQLSPGELSNPHKHLEGLANCTQCHDIGNKATNEKCLACHSEIKFRTDRQLGYHASPEVKGKDCIKCHSDHHGRNFDMVRFDEKNFNHKLSGYELTGTHQTVDCRSCHKPDNIEDNALRQRRETFLGLRQNCQSCHKDVHQKTLGNDCTKCHNIEKFKPAAFFNHAKTDFPLLGEHRNVQCIECHQQEQRNGQNYQRFAGVAFNTCAACHTDPHDNQLGKNCKECHNEQSFSALGGLSHFNHARTEFPLKGKHKQVDCRECHQMNATPLSIFQDRIGVKPNACNTCHKDVHEERFGLDCAECHTENDFHQLRNTGAFNHNLTRFSLQGKHVAVDCKKCHTGASMTDPLPHNTCATCHQDYHKSQFATALAAAPDCAKCHSVEGFEESSFSLEQHAQSAFPLEGAHVATPCFACHRKEERWEFRQIGQRCADCHKDVHQGQIAEKWYPDRSCERCHLSTSWEESRFDHSKTNFALQGQHAQQRCSACHIPDAAHPYGMFAGLGKTCAQCHADVHQKQFDDKGVTNCERCHNFEAWTIPVFDHSKSRFKLEGKHAETRCSGCHKPVLLNSVAVVQYKFESFECVDCHR